MTSYLSVTAHYITDDWELKSHVISFKEIQGTHSGENLALDLLEVVKLYGIAKKVCLLSLLGLILTAYVFSIKLGWLTSDNVTVNDKAIRCLGDLLVELDVFNFDAKERRAR